MNKEIRYCYIADMVDGAEPPKRDVERIILSNTFLCTQYATKEECLEKAKEKILDTGKRCSYYYWYIYVLPIQKVDISVSGDIAWDVIDSVREENRKNSTYDSRVYEQQKELQNVIEEYINKHNEWFYVDVIKDNIEVYKIKVKKEIEIEAMDKIV